MVGEISERSLIERKLQQDGDLRMRAASSLVLVVLALAAGYLGGFWFLGLIIAIGLAMAWEWGQVVRRNEHVGAIFLGHCASIAAAAILLFIGQVFWSLAVLGAGTLVVAILAYNRRCLPSALGVLYVGLPALGLIWLRSAEPAGLLAVFFIFAVVWTTDTFSYVVGKLIGGPRLWSALSVKKTWAGLLGGIIAAGFAAYSFATFTNPASTVALTGIGLTLSVAAQIGDLTESAIKRQFGVKNTSDLIPGHGGVMDRMDGIVAAVVVATGIALALDPNAPAAALLLRH